jgi:sec-independent protein translocase protein TatB
MFNVGGGELLVIMLIALMVLGPQRLPDAARQVGKVMAEVRKVSSGFQRELKEALDADVDADPRPRRKEATPLAASVAEADAAAASTTADGGDEPADQGTAAATDVGADDDAAGEAEPAAAVRADADTAEPPGDASADGDAEIAGAPDEATADATATVEPVRPTIAPAVADALDEIAAPVDDQRAAS